MKQWPVLLGPGGTAAAILVAIVLTTTILVVPRSPAAPVASVAIKDFAFEPAVVTVPVGATVVWTNDDEETHTVTSDTGAFGSAGLDHEERFTQTFTRPGVYAYACSLHPHMRATVVVQ